jgi:hypothetical protein
MRKVPCIIIPIVVVLFTVSIFLLSCETSDSSNQVAYVQKTGQTTSYATGDEGGLQKGVSWPSPRFTDNGDGTVTDNLTELIWLQNANRPNSAQSWANVVSFATCFIFETDKTNTMYVWPVRD